MHPVQSIEYAAAYPLNPPLIHGSAPALYLTDELCQVADVEAIVSDFVPVRLRH